MKKRAIIAGSIVLVVIVLVSTMIALISKPSKEIGESKDEIKVVKSNHPLTEDRFDTNEEELINAAEGKYLIDHAAGVFFDYDKELNDFVEYDEYWQANSEKYPNGFINVIAQSDYRCPGCYDAYETTRPIRERIKYKIDGKNTKITLPTSRNFDVFNVDNIETIKETLVIDPSTGTGNNYTYDMVSWSFTVNERAVCISISTDVNASQEEKKFYEDIATKMVTAARTLDFTGYYTQQYFSNTEYETDTFFSKEINYPKGWNKYELDNAVCYKAPVLKGDCNQDIYLMYAHLKPEHGMTVSDDFFEPTFYINKLSQNSANATMQKPYIDNNMKMIYIYTGYERELINGQDTVSMGVDATRKVDTIRLESYIPDREFKGRYYFTGDNDNIWVMAVFYDEMVDSSGGIKLMEKLEEMM